MQGLSAKGTQRCACLGAQPAGFGLKSGAVGSVPQNWVPDMGEMYPDLVCTPRFQSACDEACHRLAVGPEKTLQNLPMCDRRAPTVAYSLLVACMGVPTEGSVDRAFRAVQVRPRPEPGNRA